MTPPRPTLALAISTIILTLSGCRAQPSQQPLGSAPGVAPSAAPAPPSFPSDWFGTWAGTAQLVTAGGKPFEFGMTLVIGPTKDPNRFTWTVIYSNGSDTQERPYELVALDAAKGEYEIDEKNGIKLPATLLGGALRSAFTVQGVDVVTTERLERTPDGDRLVSEMLSTREPKETGGVNGVPPVTVKTRMSLQRAELKRTMPR